MGMTVDRCAVLTADTVGGMRSGFGGSIRFAVLRFAAAVRVAAVRVVRRAAILAALGRIRFALLSATGVRVPVFCGPPSAPFSSSFVPACSDTAGAPPSGASASSAHAGAGSSVRHSASAMNALNTRFFMLFLLENLFCFSMSSPPCGQFFTGPRAPDAAFSQRSWPPPGASRPACRECG